MGELTRYGIRWNGPRQPIATPMADGYWTPWHLANDLLQKTIPRPANFEIRAALYESLRDYFISEGCPDDQAKRDADQMSDWLTEAVCDAIVPEEAQNGEG